MKFLALIQARMGSSRLPGKVLMDLKGKTVLQRVVERVAACSLVDETIVLSTIDKKDMAIGRLCFENNIRMFFGSENDVLDRYYQAARLFSPQYVIRITADCPLFDTQTLTDAIRSLESSADYAAFISETQPDGLDLEIIKFEALEKSWMEAKSSPEREHVTLYARIHPEIFKHQDFLFPISGAGKYRLTVDEPEDYELVRQIYERLGPHCAIAEILELFEKEPSLFAKNAMYKRNEGLEKSLREMNKEG